MAWVGDALVFDLSDTGEADRLRLISDRANRLKQSSLFLADQDHKITSGGPVGTGLA